MRNRYEEQIRRRGREKYLRKKRKRFEEQIRRTATKDDANDRYKKRISMAGAHDRRKQQIQMTE